MARSIQSGDLGGLTITVRPAGRPVPAVPPAPRPRAERYTIRAHPDTRDAMRRAAEERGMSLRGAWDAAARAWLARSGE